MNKAILIIGIVILVISTLVACASPGTPAQTNTSVAAGTSTPAQQTSSVTTTPTPRYGGVLKIVVVNPSNYFGYPGDMANSGAIEVSMPCLENMLRMDGNGQFDPSGLVMAYEVSQDGASVIFTLREGVKFHDGTDFDAQAAKWVLEQVKKARLTGAELFTSAEVVDSYHVKLNIKHFDSRVLQTVADAKVSSPTAFDKYGRDKIHSFPVGTGPFKFVSFTPDIGVTWERFDDYWGGKPYLDGIKTFFIADDTARATALQSGDVDVVCSLSTDKALAFKSMGYIIDTGRITNLWTMFPDSANESSPLNKLEVRQAIEYAIDKQALAQLGNGLWQAANQVSEPNSPGYISNFEGRQYNVEKAKELLTQAGYANGFDIMIFFDQARGLQDTMISVQQMLSKVGIKLDVQPVTGNVRNQYSMNGWQDGFNVQPIYCGPGQYLSAINYSLGPNGSIDVSTARPPGWEEAIDEAFNADPAGLDAACRKLNQIIFENASAISLYTAPQVIYAMPTYVHDAHLFEFGNIRRWTPETTWLSK